MRDKLKKLYEKTLIVIASKILRKTGITFKIEKGFTYGGPTYKEYQWTGDIRSVKRVRVQHGLDHDKVLMVLLRRGWPSESDVITYNLIEDIKLIKRAKRKIDHTNLFLSNLTPSEIRSNKITKFIIDIFEK